MAKPKAAAPDLDPEELALVETQYIRVLAGLQVVVGLIRTVDEELARLGKLPAGVVDIGIRSLKQARKEYGGIASRAMAIAKGLGVAIPPGVLGTPAVSGDDDSDVGRVTAETFGGGKKGEERFNRVTNDIMTGGLLPGATVVESGKKLAARAIAKLGSVRAVGAARTFAQQSAAASRRAAANLLRAGKTFAGGAVATAVSTAVAWFTAATAIRIAGPGIGSGLGNLFSTPGGLVLGALAIYLLIRR